MKRLIPLLLFVLNISLHAQVISYPAANTNTGFSTARLQRLDTAMNQWIRNGWMNGGVALIIHDGKIVYYKAAGYNNMDTKSPMQKDAIFRIASQTKAITSVALMILFEEGKLLLDDPVSKYIPSFKNQQVLEKFNAADTTYTTVPAKKEITIRELLTHTSGLGYAEIGSSEARAIYGKSRLTAGLGVTNESLLTAMTRLGTLPLFHQPGERWTYGLNSDLLGCIVEVVSGMSLEKFFESRIFVPLGMKDTYFRVPATKANRLVKMYTEDSSGNVSLFNGKLFGSAAPDYPLQNNTYFSGGAGLTSTIYDYAIFLQMLLNGGSYGEGQNKKQLLSRSSVHMMTTNQIGEVLFRANGDKFGLGFQLVTDKSDGNTPSRVGTFGWGGAFATSYWVDPKEKLVLQFYRQLQWTSRFNDIAEKFRVLVYQALQ